MHGVNVHPSPPLHIDYVVMMSSSTIVNNMIYSRVCVYGNKLSSLEYYHF
jgi:hypothetical protein